MSTKDNNNKLYVRVGIVHFFEKNKKKNRYCNTSVTSITSVTTLILYLKLISTSCIILKKEIYMVFLIFQSIEQCLSLF